MTRTLRGISPVVATALLVLIAVAVSVLLYTWVSGTVSNQPTSSPSLQERITIDSVSYNPSSGTLTVYVRNIGNIPVNLSTVYVINASNGEVIKENTSVTNIEIPPGSVGSVNVTGLSLKSGSTIIVKVVTKDGVTATYVETIRS